MTDVTAEAIDSDCATDEVHFVKSRKVSCKKNDPVVEERAVKRCRKQKGRPKRTKLLKPAASSVTSDFISSSRRLTRSIGLFSNGKTSTRVSRFEFMASAETKARVEQDLQKILNLACNHNAGVASDKLQVHDSADVSPQKCACPHKSSDKVKDKTVSSSPANHNMALSSHQKTSRVSDSFHKNVETLSSSQIRDSDVTKKFNPSGVDKGSVINRLHATLNKKCKELFPGVSLNTSLKSELLALQKELRMSRSECSSTEVLPCGVPSQTNTSPVSEPNYTSLDAEADFCLNPQTFPKDDQSSAVFKLDFHPPESLPYSVPIKEWLFSVSPTEKRSFINPDKELVEEKQVLYQNDVCDDYMCDGYDLLHSSSFKRTPKKYAVLTSASPDSDGQPTWKLESSPHKPLLDSPTASWSYLRCKMY